MKKLTIIGNLTKDPELKTVKGANGETKVLDIDVAVNSYENGEKVVTYFRLTAWGKTAESIAQYTKKGSKIYVEAERIKAVPFNRKDGTLGATIEGTIVEHEFLNSKPDGTTAQPATAAEPAAPAENDDLPF